MKAFGMFDIEVYLQQRKDRINRELGAIVGNDSEKSRVRSAMEYALMGGGKRLRPILCLAGADAVGGCSEHSLIAACAIEMIHTYSLVHDDLPAMDDDSLRRGRPTCHMAFDEATAILAGDALLTLAFEVLSSDKLGPPVSAEKRLDIIHRVARAAGCRGMIEGQMRDIAAEGHVLTIDELETVHILKTGELLKASVYTGAVLGNGSPDQLRQLDIYGHCIGLAFQVKDDILNVVGNPAVMGKSAGTDRLRGKTTYPSILGLEKAEAFAEKLITDALQALEFFDSRSDPLRALARYILERTR